MSVLLCNERGFEHIPVFKTVTTLIFIPKNLDWNAFMPPDSKCFRLGVDFMEQRYMGNPQPSRAIYLENRYGQINITGAIKLRRWQELAVLNNIHITPYSD